MILTDIFRPEPDLQWELAAQLGVRNAVIRLPENPEFNYTDPVMMKEFFDRFRDRGFRPLVIEPMPNRLHDHIKRGDELRDECIETVKKMIPILKENGIETICTNFVVEVGWYRTSATLPERGGALVTEFNIDDVNIDPSLQVRKEEVWERLEYFLKAVMPVCEEYDVNIALHPDDPPVERLGNLERILISRDNIQKALDIYPSRNLGVTMCQANYLAMGENVFECIRHFGRQKKLFFVHFRDIAGTKEHFHETFHDNGPTDMAECLRTYKEVGFNGPIRIDHVPTMAGENNANPGYQDYGRLYAIGYLRGLCEALDYPLE